MYLFFNEKGILREIINDEALRVGNNDLNHIYIYWENAPEVESMWVRFQLPSGEMTNELNYSHAKVTKTIPYNKERDLKYFKDFTQYEFFDILIPDGVNDKGEVEGINVLAEDGLVSATVRFVLNSGTAITTLGLITFNVEKSVIASDLGINQSQFDYLLKEYTNLAKSIYALEFPFDTENLNDSEAIQAWISENWQTLTTAHILNDSIGREFLRDYTAEENKDYVSFFRMHSMKENNPQMSELYFTKEGGYGFLNKELATDEELNNEKEYLWNAINDIRSKMNEYPLIVKLPYIDETSGEQEITTSFFDDLWNNPNRIILLQREDENAPLRTKYEYYIFYYKDEPVTGIVKFINYVCYNYTNIKHLSFRYEGRHYYYKIYNENTLVTTDNIFDTDNKIKSSLLPSYVDDVVEYATFDNFPTTGETGKIYVDLSTNNTYRWSGSQYILLSTNTDIVKKDYASTDDLDFEEGIYYYGKIGNNQYVGFLDTNYNVIQNGKVMVYDKTSKELSTMTLLEDIKNSQVYITQKNTYLQALDVFNTLTAYNGLTVTSGDVDFKGVTNFYVGDNALSITNYSSGKYVNILGLFLSESNNKRKMSITCETSFSTNLYLYYIDEESEYSKYSAVNKQYVDTQIKEITSQVEEIKAEVQELIDKGAYIINVTMGNGTINSTDLAHLISNPYTTYLLATGSNLIFKIETNAIEINNTCLFVNFVGTNAVNRIEVNTSTGVYSLSTTRLAKYDELSPNVTLTSQIGTITAEQLSILKNTRATINYNDSIYRYYELNSTYLIYARDIIMNTASYISIKLSDNTYSVANTTLAVDGSKKNVIITYNISDQKIIPYGRPSDYIGKSLTEFKNLFQYSDDDSRYRLFLIFDGVIQGYNFNTTVVNGVITISDYELVDFPETYYLYNPTSDTLYSIQDKNQLNEEAFNFYDTIGIIYTDNLFKKIGKNKQKPIYKPYGFGGGKDDEIVIYTIDTIILKPYMLNKVNDLYIYKSKPQMLDNKTKRWIRLSDGVPGYKLPKKYISKYSLIHNGTGEITIEDFLLILFNGDRSSDTYEFLIRFFDEDYVTTGKTNGNHGSSSPSSSGYNKIWYEIKFRNISNMYTTRIPDFVTFLSFLNNDLGINDIKIHSEGHQGYSTFIMHIGNGFNKKVMIYDAARQSYYQIPVSDIMISLSINIYADKERDELVIKFRQI